jgi:hypothetical protein
MAVAPCNSHDFVLLARRAQVHLGRAHPMARKRRCGQDTPMYQAWMGAEGHRGDTDFGKDRSKGKGKGKGANRGSCKTAWKTKGTATGLYSRETTPGIGVTHVPMVHVEVAACPEASPGPIAKFGFGDYHGPGPGPGSGSGSGSGSESGIVADTEQPAPSGLVLSVSSIKGDKGPKRALVVGVQRREVQEVWDMGLGILQEPCASFGAGKLFLSASIARVV